MADLNLLNLQNCENITDEHVGIILQKTCQILQSPIDCTGDILKYLNKSFLSSSVTIFQVKLPWKKDFLIVQDDFSKIIDVIRKNCVVLEYK